MGIWETVIVQTPVYFKVQGLGVFSKLSFLQRTTCRYALSWKRAMCSRQHYYTVIFCTFQGYPHIPHSPSYTPLPQVTWSLTSLLHRMYTISLNLMLSWSCQNRWSVVYTLQSSHRGSLHTARATHYLSDRWKYEAWRHGLARDCTQYSWERMSKEN